MQTQRDHAEVLFRRTSVELVRVPNTSIRCKTRLRKCQIPLSSAVVCKYAPGGIRTCVKWISVISVSARKNKNFFNGWNGPQGAGRYLARTCGGPSQSC